MHAVNKMTIRSVYTAHHADFVHSGAHCFDTLTVSMVT